MAGTIFAKVRSDVLIAIFTKGGHMTTTQPQDGDWGKEELQTCVVPPLTKGAHSSLSPQSEQLHHHLSPAVFMPLAMLLKIPLTLTLLHVACLHDNTPWPGSPRHSFHVGIPAACKGSAFSHL